MNLMKKMAMVIKADQIKKANENIDYTKTYKNIYLDENKQPIYQSILDDLLGHAEEVKKAEEREEFFREPEVGHFHGSVNTDISIMTRVPLNVVLIDNYEDNLDGLYKYVQTSEATKIAEMDFKEGIECDEGDLDSVDVSINWDEETSEITFECKYSCVLIDKR